MKNLIVFFSMLFVAGSIFAQNEELFEQGNAAYAGGNYEQAVSAYEKILENGEESAALYFNLANAHYKQNHIAPSIYNYEKALQLAPDDADIKTNLEFAQRMALDEIQAREDTGFNLDTGISFNTWGWISIICSLLFALLFLLYYFSRKTIMKRSFFAGALLILIFGLIAVYFAFSQYNLQQNTQYAIVYSEEAEIRNEPSLREDVSFILHEGAKTRVLEDYQNWVRIELANGAQGWIDGSHLKKL
ncbi:tetratricopeptide repeat protein [Salegentibacter sp. HM20]